MKCLVCKQIYANKFTRDRHMEQNHPIFYSGFKSGLKEAKELKNKKKTKNYTLQLTPVQCNFFATQTGVRKYFFIIDKISP